MASAEGGDLLGSRPLRRLAEMSHSVGLDADKNMPLDVW